MRKAALAIVGIVATSLMLSGCGTKVPGVPDTVAKVNGKAIPAAKYLDQVSRRAGQDVLRNLIEQQIMLQWADEEKVAPTSAQVQEQIDLLKGEGVYDDQVKTMGEDNVKSEIEGLQARINLAKKFTKITPDQLKQIYESTKPRWVHGERKQIAAIVNSDSTKLDEALKKIKAGSDYDDVASEFGPGTRGAIKVWVDEGKPTGIPEGIVKATKATKVGEVSKVTEFGMPGGPSQFAIIKVIQEQPKENKSFEQVKGQLENLAAMQASQMDPTFIEKLNSRLKDAKVEVDIEGFKGLVQQFKNPPEAPSMMPTPRRAPAAPRKAK